MIHFTFTFHHSHDIYSTSRALSLFALHACLLAIKFIRLRICLKPKINNLFASRLLKAKKKKESILLHTHIHIYIYSSTTFAQCHKSRWECKGRLVCTQWYCHRFSCMSTPTFSFSAYATCIFIKKYARYSVVKNYAEWLLPPATASALNGVYNARNRHWSMPDLHLHRLATQTYIHTCTYTHSTDSVLTAAGQR